MNLSIGTAGFGMDYGIYNKTDKVGIEEIKKIFNLAKINNIKTLDTAQAYGDSEKIIGNLNSSTFRVVTKIKPGTKFELIEKSIELSMKYLQRERLDAVLFHEFNDYISNKNNFLILDRLKRDGKIERIGFSLYYTEHLKYLLRNKIDFDIVQLPYSVFDQRFKQYFPILKERNIKIHVRSVFLQGLVFLDINKLPDHFKKNKQQFFLLNEFSDKYGIPVSAICLNFAYNQNEIEKVVVGVKSQKELSNNIEHIKCYAEVSKNLNFEELSINDENITLPMNWPLNG